MRIIAFSLYGSAPKYTVGALRNAALATRLFPEFTCRFYYDDTAPKNEIHQLSLFSNTQLVNMTGREIPKMMWRFLPADDPSVECFISRDTDSRLSVREKSVIDHWLNSDRQFILIKDNPLFHGTSKMMGGMWGMKNNNRLNMKEMITEWCSRKKLTSLDKYNDDQVFLDEMIFPMASGSLAYYDNYNLNKSRDVLPIAVRRSNYHYIGEVFDEHDHREEHWKAIRDHDLFKYGWIGRRISSLLWRLGI